MIALLLACADPARIVGPGPATPRKDAPPISLAREDRFAEHAPASQDVVLVVDPAVASDPGLHDIVEILLEPGDVRLAVASMVAGSFPEWSARVDWPGLAAESGPLAAYDVAMSATGLTPDASLQVVFASGGSPDLSRATLDQFVEWVSRDADPRASAAHVLGACGREVNGLALAADATIGLVAEVCDLPTPVANAIRLTEWGYALSDRPREDSLRVQVEVDGWVLGNFQRFDPITGYGDYSFDPASNAVSFVAYEPTGVVVVAYEAVLE